MSLQQGLPGLTMLKGWAFCSLCQRLMPACLEDFGTRACKPACQQQPISGRRVPDTEELAGRMLVGFPSRATSLGTAGREPNHLTRNTSAAHTACG